MKKSILFISLLSLFAGVLQAQPLKKSVTWENICNHPAPLPVAGKITLVKSDLQKQEAGQMWPWAI